MPKRNQRLTGLFLALLLPAAVLCWSYAFRGNTAFSGERRFLHIRTGATAEQVMQQLADSGWLARPTSFRGMARWMRYGPGASAGRYEIRKGMGNYQLISMLKAGRQKPVRLVINKLRTREDFVQKIGRQLEADTNELRALLRDTAFLSGYGLDTQQALCAVMPATYEFYWNTGARKAFEKIAQSYHRYWNEERRQAAAAIGLSVPQVIILASIVEEETNQDEEKPQIAGVYLNRYRLGMKLGADPTVKFALQDFGLRRILNKHTAFPSPYNTYYAPGLPPGPICTPSAASIEAVLHPDPAPNLFFCAREDFSGFHRFARTYDEHLANARKYQQALDARGIR